MKTKEAKRRISEAFGDGYTTGLIVSRYYALRFATDDIVFDAPAPMEIPDVVSEIIGNICRDCRDEYLFGDGWSSIDHLLLCNSPEEVSARQESTGSHSIN